MFLAEAGVVSGLIVLSGPVVVALITGLLAAISGIVIALIQVKGVKNQQNEIHHEVKPNSGHSMKDQMNRIDRNMEIIVEDIKFIRSDVTEVRVEQASTSKQVEVNREDIHDLKGLLGARRRSDRPEDPQL